MSPRILLPDGRTAWKAVLDPTDILASGEKTALQKAGMDMGENPTQISVAQAVDPGSDEFGITPAVPGPSPSIFSPRIRRTTQPDLTPSESVPRRRY